MNAFKAWGESTEIDSDGCLDFYGLQTLAFRQVVIDGECFLRRRIRRSEDGLSLPLQIQIIDTDFLDKSKNIADKNTTIIAGVEYNKNWPKNCLLVL